MRGLLPVASGRRVVAGGWTVNLPGGGPWGSRFEGVMKKAPAGALFQWSEWRDSNARPLPPEDSSIGAMS